MMAPNACNCRPWEFIVVREEELLSGIMQIHYYTRMLKTASLAIVVCGKPEAQDGVCVPYWPQDCGAAIQNLLLAAEELGCGTCWCGCYPDKERVEGLQKLLHVTGVPMAVVAIGKADEKPVARGFYDEKQVIWL